MNPRHLLLTISLVAMGWLSTPASASLIDDSVECFFDVNEALLIYSGSCSTSSSELVTGPAIVNGDGLAAPEFYAGVDFLSFGFNVGVLIDITEDAILVKGTRLLDTLAGFAPYDFTLELRSLDWLGDPTGFISGISTEVTALDLGSVDVTHTDDSVLINFIDVRASRNTLLRVDLLTSSAPLPASNALLLIGLLLLRRFTTSVGRF